MNWVCLKHKVHGNISSHYTLLSLAHSTVVRDGRVVFDNTHMSNYWWFTHLFCLFIPKILQTTEIQMPFHLQFSFSEYLDTAGPSPQPKLSYLSELSEECAVASSSTSRFPWSGINRDLAFSFRTMSSYPCSHSLGFSAGFGNFTHETGAQESVGTAVICLLAEDTRLQLFCNSVSRRRSMWRSEEGTPKPLGQWGLDPHC